MKKLLNALILACVVTGLHGQVAPASAPKTPDLPRFDFEFKGGTPKELVEALNAPLKGSLNVIIPDDSNKAPIPSIKVKGANVQEIFESLSRASQKTVYIPIRQGTTTSFQSATEHFVFQPTTPITENSVWSFQYQDRRPPLMKMNSVRFYQLGPYLDGLKVDDIVTAIQTAWQMLEAPPEAKLKFHPETQLLIAVGQEGDFALIDAVLKELPKKPDPNKEPREPLKIK